MPTLQDVAQRAGVSTATVSKVLSNTPYFTDETRDKVMRAVRELGYLPNLAGRALSSGRTHIITVVFPYIFDAIFKDPLVMQIIEGIEAVCNERGYNLLLSTPRLTADGPDDNYQQLIRSGYIDGLIAIDNVPLASVSTEAAARNIPLVVAGYHPAQYWVRTDDRQGGALLAEHLLGLGHRRMGIITVPPDMNYALNARLNGLTEATAEAGLNAADFPVAYADFSISGGRAAAGRLLADHPHLTALICLNDRMAIGAMQALQAAGVRVPDEVSVVGYDDIQLARLSNPALTTVDQRASALGQHAAEMLFQILRGETPETCNLPVALRVRASTGPATRRSQ